jgi:hypothetical protein
MACDREQPHERVDLRRPLAQAGQRLLARGVRDVLALGVVAEEPPAIPDHATAVPRQLLGRGAIVGDAPPRLAGRCARGCTARSRRGAVSILGHRPPPGPTGHWRSASLRPAR